MSDAPLTERRFIELLELRLQPIKKDISELKKDVSELKNDMIIVKKQVQDLKGFQDHESEAIEFELRLVLEKYLQKKYPLYTVDVFPMKDIYDPYTNERITDFDAAYLLKPYHKNRNKELNDRLKEHSIQYTRKKDKADKNYIFVLAEAKHYIDSDKIKTKLWQFDRICHLFSLANDIHQTKDREKRTEFGVHPKFLSTVQYNQYLAHIRHYRLFFGAAYWQKGLMHHFRQDVKNRNRLYKEFVSASDHSKIKTYHAIIAIEKKWYNTDQLPNRPELSNDEIMQLQDLQGAMKYVDFIQPSGERYSIIHTTEPVGISSISLQGGSPSEKDVKNILYNT